ncbi:N-terminal C2 in EEIG1 and EHBP1 proteins-domain-containing protein [Haematococcus lacustris]
MFFIYSIHVTHPQLAQGARSLHLSLWRCRYKHRIKRTSPRQTYAMFRKLGKALGGGGKSQTIKVRFDLQVVQVDRLPTAVRKCRVVWARNAKVQMTAVKEVRNGVATFKQTLTQVSTVQRDKAGHFEPKEYTVKVQVPQGSGNETVGKATIDLAQFVGDANNTQTDTIPITFSAGGTSTGYVKVVITATHMGDMSEDGLTEVSGMTGLTSDGPHHAEQDLEGFDETSSSKVSDRKGTTHKPEKFGQRGRAQQLPAMQEEGSMDEQFTPAPAASKSQKPEVNFGKRAAASKPAPRPTWHDDEDVSSVDSELEDDPPPRPPPKPEPKQKKGLLGLMQAPEEEEEKLSVLHCLVPRPSLQAARGLH